MNGPVGDAMVLRLVPRGVPYQRRFPDSPVSHPLSTAGSGTLPSDVMPYQILFSAVACARLTQSGVVFLPATPLLPAIPWHRTLASLVGS
ncbi:hypothetical protein FQZ97_1147470 [compost metagenome]